MNKILSVIFILICSVAIGQTECVVAPVKSTTDILWRGLPNEVEITVPGYKSSELNIEVSESDSVEYLSDNRWAIRPGIMDLCTVRIFSVPDEGEQTLIAVKPFRVLRIPDPIVNFLGYGHLCWGVHDIQYADLDVTKKVKVDIGAFVCWGVDFSVDNFSFIASEFGNSVFEQQSDSNELTSDMKDFIRERKRLKQPFQFTILSYIKLPDGSERRMPELRFSVS